MRNSNNGPKKRRLATLVNLHGDKRGVAAPTVYPYPEVLPIELFEAAADELGLCGQQRRVAMGRVLNYSLPEVAKRMNLSLGTVRGHDRLARERTSCEDGGELVRLILSRMFSSSEETSEL